MRSVKKVVLILLSIIFISALFKQDASAYQLNAGNRGYTSSHYYSDGTYEYATGLTYLMDNKKSGGSANDLSASTPQIQKDSDSGQHAIWNRFRDMWTIYNEYGNVTTDVNDSSNFDGWSFYKAEWATKSEYDKYCTNYNFYSDYINNLDWNLYNNVKYGIETAPSGQYFYCGGVANKYRRSVLLIFRRKLSKAHFGANYIDDVGTTYANGGTLWKKSGDTKFRSWSYDAYDYGGQYPQYSGGIADVLLDVNRVNPSNKESKHETVKVHRTSTTVRENSYIRKDVDMGFKSVGLYGTGSVTDIISNPNAYGYSTGYKYPWTGAGLYFNTQNGYDYQLLGTASNKHNWGLDSNTNGSGMYHSSDIHIDGRNWMGGFRVGAGHIGAVYNWLKIDDDAPSIDGLPIEAQKNMLSCTFTVKTKDTRSGFKSLKIYDNDTEITDKALKKSSEEDTSEHEQTVTINTVGTHKIKVESTDNLDNTKKRYCCFYEF